MVIQRWQSVLLLLATIFMVLLCVLPLGSGVSDIDSHQSNRHSSAIYNKYSISNNLIDFNFLL